MERGFGSEMLLDGGPTCGTAIKGIFNHDDAERADLLEPAPEVLILGRHARLIPCVKERKRERHLRSGTP